MKHNHYLILLIFLIFYAISFLTNIRGSINANVTDSFRLTGTMTGMLPFSFFIASCHLITIIIPFCLFPHHEPWVWFNLKQVFFRRNIGLGI